MEGGLQRGLNFGAGIVQTGIDQYWKQRSYRDQLEANAVAAKARADQQDKENKLADRKETRQEDAATFDLSAAKSKQTHEAAMYPAKEREAVADADLAVAEAKRGFRGAPRSAGDFHDRVTLGGRIRDFEKLHATDTNLSPENAQEYDALRSRYYEIAGVEWSPPDRSTDTLKTSEPATHDWNLLFPSTWPWFRSQGPASTPGAVNDPSAPDRGDDYLNYDRMSHK